MKKFTFIAILLLVASLGFSQRRLVFQQGETPYKKIHTEFQLVSSEGGAWFQYELQNANSWGFGGNIGLNVNILFNEYVGLLFGADVGCFNTRINAKNVEIHNENWYDYQIDGADPYVIANSRYDLTTVFNSYKERQSTLMVGLPVALHLQTKTYDIARFYAQIGLKLGIPFYSHYYVKNGILDNYAYYPNLDNTVYYSGALENHFTGFGRQTDINIKENTAFNISLMTTMEFGTKFVLNNSWAFYLGLFVDYGINDIRKVDKYDFVMSRDNASDFINHVDGKVLKNVDEKLSINSLIYSNGNPNEALVKRMVPIATGMRMRLSLSTD
jgi:hypothetical protein